MARKYHLSENGPRECTASKRACPVSALSGAPAGTIDAKHYASQDEAAQAYQAHLKNTYGTMPSVYRKEKARALKNNRSIRQENYRIKDEIQLRRQLGGGRNTIKVAALQKQLVANHPLVRIGKSVTKNTGKIAYKSARMGFKALASAVPGGRSSRSTKRNVKKLLMTKYWMPDIHSNKWK